MIDMRKLLGVILFIVCSVGIIVCIYSIAKNYSYWQDNYSYISVKESVIYSWIILIALSLAVYYVILTKFGSSKATVVDNLNAEIEIIKKQIEKRELMSKLESLEKK